MAYIDGLSYRLGMHLSTTSLKDEGVSRESILQLVVRGAQGYCRRTQSLFTVALTTAKAALKKAGIDNSSIGVLLFGTNSLRAADFQQDFGHALITELGLKNAHVQLVGFQNCGDSVPLLRTANALVESGTALNVLVLIADDVIAANIPRILKNSYLHSDGAAACVVSATERGYRIGQGLTLHASAHDSTGADLYDLEGHLDELLTKAASVVNNFAGTNASVDFVVTHNMNSLFNQRVATALGVLGDKVVGEYALGHCLASDVLINLARLTEQGAVTEGQTGIVVAPTRRSIGVLLLTYCGGEVESSVRDAIPAECGV